MMERRYCCRCEDWIRFASRDSVAHDRAIDMLWMCGQFDETAWIMNYKETCLQK